MQYVKDDFTVTFHVINEDLTGSSVKIKYQKPSSRTILEKAPSSINYDEQLVIYNFPSADNDEVGDITIWIEITNQDGKITNSPLPLIKINIKNQGKL